MGAKGCVETTRFQWKMSMAGGGNEERSETCQGTENREGVMYQHRIICQELATEDSDERMKVTGGTKRKQVTKGRFTTARAPRGETRWKLVQPGGHHSLLGTGGGLC